MKQILIAALITIIAVTASFAARSELESDARGAKVQGFAPNGKKDRALTAVKTSIDMREDTAWAVYCASDSVYRTMSTTTVTGVAKTIVGGAWHTRVVNRSSTPYLNFSGCAGQLERQ